MTQLIQVQRNEEKYFFFLPFYNLMRIVLATSTSLSRMLLIFFKFFHSPYTNLVITTIFSLALSSFRLGNKDFYYLTCLWTAFLMHIGTKTLVETHMSACATVLLSFPKWVYYENLNFTASMQNFLNFLGFYVEFLLSSSLFLPRKKSNHVFLARTGV